MPGETAKAYEALLCYMQLGPNRTYAEVCRRLGKNEVVMTSWSQKYNWMPRVALYDRTINAERIEATRQAEIERAKLITDRRAETQHVAYELAAKLEEKVRQMLEAPLFETTEERLAIEKDEDGRDVNVQITRITKPVRWSLRDIPYFVEAQDRLRRLSLDMSTENVAAKIEVDINDPAVRVQKAQEAYQQLLAGIDKIVQTIIQNDPTLHPEKAKADLQRTLPEWVAEDWGIESSELKTPEGAIIDVVAEEVK